MSDGLYEKCKKEPERGVSFDPPEGRREDGARFPPNLPLRRRARLANKERGQKAERTSNRRKQTQRARGEWESSRVYGEMSRSRLRREE